jgi:CRP-like cAMP-binding protein
MRSGRNSDWAEQGNVMLNASNLAHLIPLSELSGDALSQAANLAAGTSLEAGQVLFRKGAVDARTFYLLDGEVALDSEDGSQPLRVKAGSDTARHPVSRLKPRTYTCVARTPCKMVAFADDDLDHLVARDQATAYEVTEFEGDDPQWMFDLLSNPAFSQVPPGNLHILFSRFEAIPVSAGQEIVRQGEAGDYYYLIRSGLARVTRTAAYNKEIPLAVLKPGQGFGEEALISGDPRNATVTMASDGELMRLPAADFDSLLREPLVHNVNLAQGAELIKQGAQLIDVRLEAEFAEGSLKGSTNLPLYLLRLKANSLDRKKTYLLFCQSGRRSSAAAFLLSQRGFDARVLQGGLAGLKKPAQK